MPPRASRPSTATASRRTSGRTPGHRFTSSADSIARPTVTVCGAENPHNLNDHVSNASPGILAMIASSMASMGSNNAYLYGEPILALGPEHAAILARGGLSKNDIRRYLWEQARIPRPQWERGGMYGMTATSKDLFPGDPALPIVREPEDLMIIVVGAAGRHSCWIPTFGAMTKSVTRAIALVDGTPARTVDEFQRRSA